MLISGSKPDSGQFFAFNNSAFSILLSNSSSVALKCIEYFGDQTNTICEIYWNVDDKKEHLIYLPMNSKPSFEGKRTRIKWFIEEYKGKNQIDQKEIIMLSYPFVTNIKESYDIKKDDVIFLFKKDINKIIINFDKNIKVKKVKIEFTEFYDGEKNILLSKEQEFLMSPRSIFLEVHGSDIIQTFRGFKAILKGNLSIEESEATYNIPIQTYDFNIFESIKLGDVLEAMIFKHLALYGPQTLGMLVSNIALKEKMRVKSIDVKDACKEMNERNLLEKNDREWNSATYYLNSRIYELFIKR